MQLGDLNADQLAYKGLTEGRDRLTAWLNEQASKRQKTPAL